MKECRAHIVFPLIYFAIKKFKIKGLFSVILFEFIYMLLCNYLNIDRAVFRILFFRYISIVALGTYYAVYRPKLNRESIFFIFLIGFTYILLIVYSGKNLFYPYMRGLWGNRSGIFVGLYVFAIFHLLFKYLKDCEIKNIFGKMLSYIGKASWHIMLIQMFYYFAFDKYLKATSFPIHLSINILVCLILGSIYYMIDTKFITNKMLKLIKL